MKPELGDMTGSRGFLHRIRTGLGRLSAGFVNVIYRTGRFTNSPDNPKEYSAGLGPVIVAAWHGQNMILPPFWHQQHRLEILVSRHESADIAATAYNTLKLKVIRGSGSAPGKVRARKGGTEALRQMVRSLKSGSSVALTADMPPGPARRAGRGIIMLARISGNPILPLAVTTRYRLVAHNWCRFAVNLPFSRGSIAVGQPILVPRDADKAMLENKRLELEDCLNALTVQADTLVGRKPHYDAGGPVPRLNSSYYFYSGVTRLLSPLASFWLARRLARGKEQQGRTDEKLGTASLPRPEGRLLWLHATSIGEATSCLGLMSKLLLSRDDLSILVTTTTLSAAEVLAKRLPKRSFHQFAPLDIPRAVGRFLEYWRPDMAVFAESEIWPNTIAQLHKQKTPIALVNARLSKRSYRRWRKVPGLIRTLLARFDHISSQTHKDEQRLASLGSYNTVCYGNMKADVSPAPVSQKLLLELKQQIGSRRIWLAASTHKGEEEFILECHKILAADFPDLLTIIVPRHRERAEAISTLISARNLTVSTRSSGTSIGRDTDIYLADTLGELPLFYELSAISFVGGSLVKIGGHNPIEAIDGRSAVLHGPHVHNFNDMYELLDRQGGAIKIADSTELAKEVELLLNSPEKVMALTVKGKAQAASLKGATEKTASALLELLDKPSRRSG